MKTMPHLPGTPPLTQTRSDDFRPRWARHVDDREAADHRREQTASVTRVVHDTGAEKRRAMLNTVRNPDVAQGLIVDENCGHCQRSQTADDIHDNRDEKRDAHNSRQRFRVTSPQRDNRHRRPKQQARPPGGTPPDHRRTPTILPRIMHAKLNELEPMKVFRRDRVRHLIVQRSIRPGDQARGRRPQQQIDPTLNQ